MVATSRRNFSKGTCVLPFSSLITASLLAVYPVIALARVGKTTINSMVVIMKAIASFDLRPRLLAKSRIKRKMDTKETSFRINVVQNVWYVIGVVSMDALT